MNLIWSINFLESFLFFCWVHVFLVWKCGCVQIQWKWLRKFDSWQVFSKFINKKKQFFPYNVWMLWNGKKKKRNFIDAHCTIIFVNLVSICLISLWWEIPLKINGQYITLYPFYYHHLICLFWVQLHSLTNINNKKPFVADANDHSKLSYTDREFSIAIWFIHFILLIGWIYFW